MFTWVNEPWGIIRVSTDGSHYVTPTLKESPDYPDFEIRVKEYRKLVLENCKPLPEAWIFGILFAEKAPPNALNQYGRVGAMQVDPQLAHLTTKQLLDVRTNVAAGCKILARLASRPGTDLPALASMYSSGEALSGGPHLSTWSRWGFKEEDEFYIIRCVSASNEYLLRGDKL